MQAIGVKQTYSETEKLWLTISSLIFQADTLSLVAKQGCSCLSSQSMVHLPLLYGIMYMIYTRMYLCTYVCACILTILYTTVQW